MENIKKPSDLLLICGFIFFGVLLAFSLSVPGTESKKPAAVSEEDDGSDLSSYVTLGEYKGLKLSSKPVEVSDDDVNALYENFRPVIRPMMKTQITALMGAIISP